MATGVYTDFVIRQEEFFTGMTEVLMQNSNTFNGASNGTIQLVAQRLKGHYDKDSFFKAISGLTSRRDISSVAAATDLKLEQGETIGVKINRKIGPVANTLDAFRKIASDPSEMSFILGQQTGAAVAVDYANSAIRAIKAALANIAALKYDHSGTGTLTHNALVSGMAKMGDAGERISCWIMHSKVWYDLVGQAITDKIFEVGSLAVYKGTTPTLGRPVVVIDSAALVTSTSAATTYHTLGLTPGAVKVTESEDRQIVSEIVTGLENLVLRIQGEYAFSLGLKGFAWDTTNGGVNPTDSAVGTGSNWDQVFSDTKALGGVVIDSD